MGFKPFPREPGVSTRGSGNPMRAPEQSSRGKAPTAPWSERALVAALDAHERLSQWLAER
jgi:hypothetical protein